MSGKRYPEAFKLEAVKQVSDRGYKVWEVADRWGFLTTDSLEIYRQRLGMVAMDRFEKFGSSDELMVIAEERVQQTSVDGPMSGADTPPGKVQFGVRSSGNAP